MRISTMLPVYAQASNLQNANNANNLANAQNNLAAAASAISNNINNQTEAGSLNIEAHVIGECETCNSRVYQDDSLDGGVSFQNATHISPQNAASAVIGHEREHQQREAMTAEYRNHDVISNEIQIFTCRCPECGRVYVSGGVTETVTRPRQENPAAPMSVMDLLVSGEYPR